jgi:hypothetical protein
MPSTGGCFSLPRPLLEGTWKPVTSMATNTLMATPLSRGHDVLLPVTTLTTAPALILFRTSVHYTPRENG